jgi:hypothetical protein
MPAFYFYDCNKKLKGGKIASSVVYPAHPGFGWGRERRNGGLLRLGANEEMLRQQVAADLAFGSAGRDGKARYPDAGPQRDGLRPRRRQGRLQGTGGVALRGLPLQALDAKGKTLATASADRMFPN